MTRVLVGTSGWSYNEWVGPFYPPGTVPADFLAIYSSRFTAVEVDSTFFGIPRATVVQRWREATPAGFTFCLKAPRAITHEKALVGTRDELKTFLGAATVLREKLGCVLFQMPPSFDRTRHQSSLAAFLSELPSAARYALELRHRSWRVRETLDLCGEHGVAVATTDFDKDFNVSTDLAYVRFLGGRSQVELFNRVVIDRAEELAIWAERTLRLSETVNRVFAFFNNHYSGHSPETAAEFAALIRGRGGRT